MNSEKSELEKMTSGELYNAMDKTLSNMRMKSAQYCQELNQLDKTLSDFNEKCSNIFSKLFGKCGKNAFILPPFNCDYGCLIEIGDNVFINYNCVILDCVKVKIGNNVLFGPNVSLYAATHPVQQIVRATGLEYAEPIEIGDNCWLGGSVVICPGVKIGKNCVVRFFQIVIFVQIGAGSVVTKNIPDNSLAVGNPAKVVKGKL